MFCNSLQLGRHTNLLKNNNYAEMKSFLIKEGQVFPKIARENNILKGEKMEAGRGRRLG